MRAAARRDHRRDGAGLGHELVLRHRELGRRHVELLGRVAHRHVARGDGARGLAPRAAAPAPSTLRRAPPERHLRRLLVHRHRRHRRRRRVAARAARSAARRSPNQPDVRFVVISSDVVYPTGAMRDYEAKFWLPFKGVTKPVYAIPGNHDWYDALEAFDATFLQARRGARQHARAGRGRPAADEHDRRAHRGSRSARRRACAGDTACRPAFSARRSSSCRPIASRSSPSTPACSGRSIAEQERVARRAR